MSSIDKPKSGYQICGKCKTEQPLDNYYHDKSKSSGYMTVCKECRRTYMKNFQATSITYKETHRRKQKKFNKTEKSLTAMKANINLNYYKNVIDERIAELKGED